MRATTAALDDEGAIAVIKPNESSESAASSGSYSGKKENAAADGAVKKKKKDKPSAPSKSGLDTAEKKKKDHLHHDSGHKKKKKSSKVASSTKVVVRKKKSSSRSRSKSVSRKHKKDATKSDNQDDDDVVARLSSSLGDLQFALQNDDDDAKEHNRRQRDDGSENTLLARLSSSAPSLHFHHDNRPPLTTLAQLKQQEKAAKSKKPSSSSSQSKALKKSAASGDERENKKPSKRRSRGRSKSRTRLKDDDDEEKHSKRKHSSSRQKPRNEEEDDRSAATETRTYSNRLDRTSRHSAGATSSSNLVEEVVSSSSKHKKPHRSRSRGRSRGGSEGRTKKSKKHEQPTSKSSDDDGVLSEQVLPVVPPPVAQDSGSSPSTSSNSSEVEFLLRQWCSSSDGMDHVNDMEDKENEKDRSDKGGEANSDSGADADTPPKSNKTEPEKDVPSYEPVNASSSSASTIHSQQEEKQEIRKDDSTSTNQTSVTTAPMANINDGSLHRSSRGQRRLWIPKSMSSEDDDEHAEDDTTFDDESLRPPRHQVDYYRNPTLLSRWIQFQRFQTALARLEDCPQEAQIWLVAKRHQPHSAAPERVTLEQLPWHMACHQLALMSAKSGGNPSPFSHSRHVLHELLTQLLLVYPQACQFADHTGYHGIQYLVQYHAPPELISLALTAHPASAKLVTAPSSSGPGEPTQPGRSLIELFEQQQRRPSSQAGLNGEEGRYQQRQQDQIAQLLEYDIGFWEQRHRESTFLQQVQQSWKEQQSNPSKDTPKTPWTMVQEKEELQHQQEETERTLDETSFGEEGNGSNLLQDSSSNFVDDGVDETQHHHEEEEEISSMGWQLLEQRALLLEQLVMESNERNFELQQRLGALKKSKTSLNSLVESLQGSSLVLGTSYHDYYGSAGSEEQRPAPPMTELDRQAAELRQENEDLKKELHEVQSKLDQQRERRRLAAACSPNATAAPQRRASWSWGLSTASSEYFAPVTTTAETPVMRNRTVNATDTLLSESQFFPSLDDVDFNLETTSGQTEHGEAEVRREANDDEQLPPASAQGETGGPQSPARSRKKSSERDAGPEENKSQTNERAARTAKRRSNSARPDLHNCDEHSRSPQRLQKQQQQDKKSQRPKKKQPSKGELRQRESNRRMHQEYHALVQKYRSQEEVLERLETTVDALLQTHAAKNNKNKDAKGKVAPTPSTREILAQERKRRQQALAWLPSSVFVPETDNLDSILQYVTDQEQEVFNKKHDDKHYWDANKEAMGDPAAATMFSTSGVGSSMEQQPGSFHRDIVLPSLSTKEMMYISSNRRASLGLTYKTEEESDWDELGGNETVADESAVVVEAGKDSSNAPMQEIVIALEGD